MNARLLAACAWTLGILTGFVGCVIFLIAYWAKVIDAYVLIGLTVGINVLMWLIAPAITDWMQRMIYKARAVSFEELSASHPELAALASAICEKHRIPLPAFRMIADANPTAFCYGTLPYNARLVLSEGIFQYLNIEEQKGVMAHELGHIVNRDFAVMTLATTLLQVLYEVYHIFLKNRRRSRRGGKGDVTPLIGAIAYLLWWIGSYMVLYLSRTREYLADRFAAQETQNPDALSMALVKIAYGIAREADTESTERLLASTRSMGIYDYKAAPSVGSLMARGIEGAGATASTDELTKVFLFDLASPWAALSEIESTHPLTGKRIRALSECAAEQHRPSRFDFKRIQEQVKQLDRGRLMQGFFSGIGYYALPGLGLFLGLLTAWQSPQQYWLAFIYFGIAILAQGFYKFQNPLARPEPTTVFSLMQDPYASPITGHFVEIQGKVIGKADAGNVLGEDLKIEDDSHGLIYLNYESIIPLIGNAIFAFGGAKQLIGQRIRATGWFRRGSFAFIDLHEIHADSGTIRSATRFWGIVWGAVLIAIGAFLAWRTTGIS